MGGRVLATRLRGSHPVSRTPQGERFDSVANAVPEKEAEGLGAAAQENGTGAERLPYAGSGTQKGNKVHTKNVRIYGEHGVCNTLCLFMDYGWGRSYSLWSVPFKFKQKTVEGTDTPYEKGKKKRRLTMFVNRLLADF